MDEEILLPRAAADAVNSSTGTSVTTVSVSAADSYKFQVGDLVSVRGGSLNTWLVIAIGAKPIDVSHKYNEKTGGTKRYDLLEVGGTRMITRMEKSLKKHRVPKTKKRTNFGLRKSSPQVPET